MDAFFFASSKSKYRKNTFVRKIMHIRIIFRKLLDKKYSHFDNIELDFLLVC